MLTDSEHIQLAAERLAGKLWLRSAGFEDLVEAWEDVRGALDDYGDFLLDQVALRGIRAQGPTWTGADMMDLVRCVARIIGLEALEKGEHIG